MHGASLLHAPPGNLVLNKVYAWKETVMLHPEVRRQLGKDNVAAVAKAAEERCHPTPVTEASQKRGRPLRKPRLEPGTAPAPPATTI